MKLSSDNFFTREENPFVSYKHRQFSRVRLSQKSLRTVLTAGVNTMIKDF